MGMITGDNLECTNCGHDEFTKQEVLSFHPKVRSREFNKDTELPHTSIRITYHCANCKQELDK